MRSEDRLLFLCARQDFHTSHAHAALDLCRRQAVDWEAVLTTAVHHSVAPLVYRNLSTATGAGLEMPESIAHRFRLSTFQNLATKAGREERLAETLAFLATQGIDAMAIKGSALDLLVYQEPWFTLSDDMDLVLRPRREEVPAHVSGAVDHFFGTRGRGIEYEFFQHHDVVMNGALPVDFHRIWQDARPIRFRGHDLYVMSPEDMLLSLCINSARKRYFRLKSLCDIAETAARSRQLDWSLLAEKARIYQCGNIVYTALLVTQMTVGCELPPGVLGQLGVGRPRTALLRRLIRFLIRRMTLPALSFYSGQELFTRRVGWSLVLPYAAYYWQQRWSKIHEAYTAWRRRQPQHR